jgi:PadR family transcriptional regulator, regulatory protein PadR
MTDASLGPLELTILLAVARLGDGAYGLAIRRDLGARTARDYSVGTIYTTLARLEAKGLVAAHLTASLPVRGGRGRREFRLTAPGARALEGARRLAASVWGGVPSTIDPGSA